MKTIKNISHTKPWRDINGKVKSDSILRQISKGWDESVWLEYLDDAVNTDDVDPFEYEFLSETDNPRYQQLHEAIRTLTPAQQNLIKFIYWQGQSLAQAGQSLKISKGSVQDLKRRTLNKLKKLLEVAPYDSHYIIEGQENLNYRNSVHDNDSMDEIIFDNESSCHI